MHSAHQLSLPRGKTVSLGPRPVVMGILNATPDSFSDGGAHDRLETAMAHAVRMAGEGAGIVDIGGESTRPGAEPVPVQDELDRVVPLLLALQGAGFATPISIDTYKPLVADQAIQAGAAIINDVHGLQGDPEMADVAALYGVPVIAMHWDKTRDTTIPLLDSVRRWFDRTIAIADSAGVARNNLILDPGFGFGKTLMENYALLGSLSELYPGFPMLVGLSRKSMIGRVLGTPTDQRLPGTIAGNVLAYGQGAHVFRVHDVQENREALAITHATLYEPEESRP